MKINTTHRRSDTGFTLIELVMVMAIIPIVVLAVAIPLIEYPRLFSAMEADREMAEQARNVLLWMGRDIRQAASVKVQAGVYKTSEQGALVLAMPERMEVEIVVWIVNEESICRMEFAEQEAEKILNKMTLAMPKSSFRLKMDAQPPSTSKVHVTINASRSLMDKDQEFSLSGEYSLRSMIP